MCMLTHGCALVFKCIGALIMITLAWNDLANVVVTLTASLRF